MTTGSHESFYGYWGKAPREKNQKGDPFHLAAYHCLDVAAVGKVLLERHDSLRGKLARSLGLDESAVTAWVTFFLALHDLGKFSEAFQGIRPDIQRLITGSGTKFPYVRHDRLGFVLWERHLRPALLQENRLPLSDAADDCWIDVLQCWAKVVFGHHGKPPGLSDPHGSEIQISTYFSAEDLSAAEDFVAATAGLFLSKDLPLSIAPEDFEPRLTQMSWLIAGVAVVSDWIGSNDRHFPYRSEPVSLDVYWESALEQAEKALDESGLLPCRVSHVTGMSVLFPEIEVPSPLQEAVETCDLPSGPQLWIIEDLTGSGKTEAALTLAHRLMAAGRAQGVFVALPTMATANAMYKRFSKAYDRVFAEGSKPSLVLSHGGRRLNPMFQGSILPEFGVKDDSYAADEETAGAVCSAWLADNRKKALLAHVGVGTVDQALLAVLPSNHQSLRLLGLSDKALIIDEAHAYDAYMNGLLKNLLQFHARLGGSAILLSATIPLKLRRELIEAFNSGPDAPETRLAKNDFPLVTCAGSGRVSEMAVDPRDDMRRAVHVELVHHESGVLDRIVSESNNGKAVCWVRNTVIHVMDAYDKLLEKGIPAERLIPFHARFAMGDRLRIEDRVLDIFGKEGKDSDRRGKVVVATQVVEQSLDLDFDFMVSDLAPIDLLIQRAGRLHRHHRNSRGEPCLVVFSPKPVDDPRKDWFSSMFPEVVKIYPDHGQLWLTAKLLDEQGGWTLPEDARDLIEGVFGEERREVPEGLMEIEMAAHGNFMADLSLALHSTLILEKGYSETDSPWLQDTQARTRLGEITTTVRLARRHDGELKPWSHGEANPWEMSQLSVNQYLIAEEAKILDPGLREAVKKAKENMPDKGKWSVLVPLQTENNEDWVGSAINESGDTVPVKYSPSAGLVVDNPRRKT